MKIFWIGTCHQNLASIHLTVSEKTMSTDRRRTPTMYVMTVALLCRKNDINEKFWTAYNLIPWHCSHLKCSLYLRAHQVDGKSNRGVLDGIRQVHFVPSPTLTRDNSMWVLDGIRQVHFFPIADLIKGEFNATVMWIWHRNRQSLPDTYDRNGPRTCDRGFLKTSNWNLEICETGTEFMWKLEHIK